jgi:hypothetical protein
LANLITSETRTLTNWFTDLLTPLSLALLEKLPVAQLLKNFQTFYEIRRFITLFTRALHLSLCWARSI